jgi:mRNA-degrading endonuclease RelE of RelBE toxin-antitoxin system
MVSFYRIAYAKGVADDLAKLRIFHRNVIFSAIEEYLRHEPANPSRRRKMLKGTIPQFHDVQPVWQLSVGEFRVFYDVQINHSLVVVLAVRPKPPHKTTDRIL